MKRLAPLVAIVTALALSGLPAEAPASLIWDASIGAGVVASDNLHLDPETPVEEGRRQPVEETIYTVLPGLRLAWDSGRDLLNLSYTGEYQQFSGDEEQDPLWVHNLAADLTWRRWAPFFMEAREERARVPRSQERETEAVVDQIDRNRVSARTGFGWDLGTRGVAELAYRGELQNYPGVPDADTVLRQYGEGRWRQRWTPLWETEMRAAYGRVERDLTADFTEARASAAVDQRLNERLTLEYSLEWVREEDEDAGDGDLSPGESGGEVRTSLLKAAALNGVLERGGGWRLSYQDSLAGLPEGDTLETKRAAADVTLRARLGSSLRGEGWYEKRDYRDSGREETAWGPVVTLRWMIAPWAACDVAGSWTSTTISELEQEEVEDRTGRVAAGVVVLLFDRLTLEAGYGFRKNDSDDPLRSYDNSLVYALLSVHFRPVYGALPASYASGFVTSSLDEPGQSSVGAATPGSGIGR